jgi:hypothetical protein
VDEVHGEESTSDNTRGFARAQAQNGVKIQIDQETKKVSIAGPAAAVAHTVHLVNELLAAPETGTFPNWLFVRHTRL